jgi:hypothetical protein
MDYTIYHNDHAACTVEINEDYRIEKVRKIHDAIHLPVGVKRESGITIYNLNDWLFSRAIPERRYGLDSILEKERVGSNRELLIKNLGLGLSDHYWIKNEKEQREWKDVNFFENDFGERGDDIYIGENEEVVGDKITPNGASSGMLPKKWMIRDGKRYMLKGSEGIFNQEPYNEVIASQFLNMLGVRHVSYELARYKGNAYSLCENMLDTETELIPAYYIGNIKRKGNSISQYEHYIDCCKELGLGENIRQELEQMIMIDYMTANTDRHWMNFGIIRNAESLAAVRLAPIYDNGASFYTKTNSRRIPIENQYLKCRSFKGNQEDNIRLVKDFSWLEGKPVRELSRLVSEGLKKNNDINDERRNAVTEGIKERIKMLGRYSGMDFGIKSINMDRGPSRGIVH